MWNRVVLLTCGMAFGWSLANYWAAPWADVAKHQRRLLISGIIGLLLVALLAWEDLPSGIIALGILLGTGLITYAGNAKQLGKPAEALYQQPNVPSHPSQIPGIVLVADAEPRRYRGPDLWCQRMREDDVMARLSPHWFLRPYACYRIRRAYHSMPEGPPSYRALSELTEQLQEHLGTGAVVRLALVWGAPLLADVLPSLAELGHGRLLILPIDLGTERVLDLRKAVVQSRVREAGVDARVLPEYAAELWAPDAVTSRLEAMLRGEALDEPLVIKPTIVDQIQSAIGDPST